MKTNRVVSCLCAFFFVIVASPKKAISQDPPIYKFDNSALESGTANTTGAVYRFTGAYTGVDALVTISGMSSGITLKNIDRIADGYLEAFQPEYRISGNTNAYIDFTINFVNAGTNTLVSQPIVAATGLDIDGSAKDGGNLYEYNRIDMGGGTSEYNSYNSQIIISQAGTAFTGTNTTGILFGALVDTSAKEVMFSVTSTSVSSMTFRVGSDNQTNSTSTRYASLYFKKFTYQHFPLAISGLLSFDGSMDNNKVTLNWELAAEKYSKVALEKSNTAANFTKVTEFITETGEGKSDKYKYTDADLSGNIVFYRLKATDETGKVEYSSILSFKLNSITKNELKIFPTVIQSSATINIDMAEKTNGLLLITDYSGRPVRQQPITLQSGRNSITIDGFEKYSSGNYIVAVRTNSALYSTKMIIQ